MTDTKAGLKALAEGRRDILSIDPRIIEVEPGFNCRDFAAPENIEHVAFLKKSILESGVKEPLTVRLKDGRVTLVGGECRLRAVLYLIEEGHDFKTVPCQVEERHTNDATRMADQITRNSGKRYMPLEMARNCQRLAGYGWDQSEIAKKLVLSPSYVSHLFSLLAMPEEAQSMVRSGEVSAAAALETVRSEGDTNGVDVLREAVQEAKSTGKKRATVGKVRSAAAKRGTGRRIGKTLNAVNTDKVCRFFHWLLTKADSIGEARAEGDRVYLEILK